METHFLSLHGSPPGKGARSIQGTIQRVHYGKREMTVIAEGRIWRFMLGANCRLLFNGTETMLRCFHSLDPVILHFDEIGADLVPVCVHSWEHGRKQAG
jgi:hypothetical protein